MMVNADIDMLKTVVRNLLSNAIKFSKENSEVLVKMEEVDGMAVVSVRIMAVASARRGRRSCCILIRISARSARTTKKARDWACCYARILS